MMVICVQNLPSNIDGFSANYLVFSVTLIDTNKIWMLGTQ